MEQRTFTVRITRDDDGSVFAEVLELPGCLASGSTFDELQEALAEALSIYLSSEQVTASVRLLDLQQASLFDVAGDPSVPTDIEFALAV